MLLDYIEENYNSFSWSYNYLLQDIGSSDHTKLLQMYGIETGML